MPHRNSKVRRSANEDMHLAMYADEDDILSPEFIRTYQHVSFRGCDLLKAEEALQSEGETKYINKSVILRPGKDRAVVHHIHEAYGYRPSHPSVWYLNVWEFCMYWEMKPFGCGQTMANLDPAKQLLFPDRPELQQLRRAFFLARRFRSRIPAPHQTKLPKPGRDSKNEMGRILSIYLRPWTLLKGEASIHVPYLADLDKPRQRREKQEASNNGKQCAKEGYWAAWLEYIQPPGDRELDKAVWDWEAVQRVLKSMSHGPEEPASGASKGKKTSAMDQSLQIGATLWAANDKPWPDDLLFGGNLPSESMLSSKKPKAKPGHANDAGNSLYAAFVKVNADAWLDQLCAEKLCPNAQQLIFLKQVIERTQREAEEELENLAPGLLGRICVNCTFETVCRRGFNSCWVC